MRANSPEQRGPALWYSLNFVTVWEITQAKHITTSSVGQLRDPWGVKCSLFSAKILGPHSAIFHAMSASTSQNNLGSCHKTKRQVITKSFPFSSLTVFISEGEVPYETLKVVTYCIPYNTSGRPWVTIPVRIIGPKKSI